MVIGCLYVRKRLGRKENPVRGRGKISRKICMHQTTSVLIVVRLIVIGSIVNRVVVMGLVVI